MPIDIADPRVFTVLPDAAHEPSIRLAEASLAASSATRADEIDRTLTTALAQRLLADDTPWLAGLLAMSPSAEVARHLWRRLIDAWRAASAPAEGEGVLATLFALPVVVVVAAASADVSSDAPPLPVGAMSGELDEIERVGALLRGNRALGGNLSFVLAASLIAADSLDIPRLGALLRWQSLATGNGTVAREIHPAPMAVQLGQESVHLRFLMGTAIGSPEADLFGAGAGEWTMPLAQELSSQLGFPGGSVLALPRPPQTPLLALQHGRAAQREIGAQLFASNAIRKFRASVGEPSAVISAHKCPAAPGGGELRLSLSSPFDPKQADGFRCPLFPPDRAVDVAAMLLDLMRDCRVTDVRVVAGVQPDRATDTGVTLLYRADAIPGGASVVLH